MKTCAVEPRRRPFLSGLLAWFCLGVCGLLHCSAGMATITNASAVLALSAPDALSGMPVFVTGVVTAAENTRDWNGRFFVQDNSGGVFVDNHDAPQPAPGDLVQVWGVTHPGGYAPVISRPHWKKIGTAPLPVAPVVSSERLLSGVEDSQRVEVSGMIRSAVISGDRIGVELASGGDRFRAYFPVSPAVDSASLVGARVTVRGTVAAAFNVHSWLRQILSVTIFCPQPADFIMDEPGPSAPFDGPPIPLNGITQYRHGAPPGSPVHVKGVVTYQRKGEGLFLRDDSGGLQVKTALTNSVFPGDEVDVVGFPAVENYLPVLEDAVFRKSGAPRSSLEPMDATIADLQKGVHHADFIRLQGRLLDRLVKGIGPRGIEAGIQTTLVLQASNMVFVAEKTTSEPNTLLAAIPIGSLIEAQGICLLDSGGDGTVKSFRLLLPTSYDVRIIKKPSWLTPQRLLIGLVSALAVLLVAVGWTIWVSKKNSMLKSLVRYKESAQRELQLAHDQLEERVRERTAQLKVEMTARKESELQFRAVLTERTRLAQELHDTLEQTLVGIALQQDLVANQFERSPENAAHHLKLARNLMRQSQEDLHRSVWGLRSRAEENFNVANALLTGASQLAGDAGIDVQSGTSGEAIPLSEIVEENLLRIGQEAVTNAVKHSGCTRIGIEWQFNPGSVILGIRDNGRGFDPDACAGPRDGHFGLLGIRERTERVGGRVRIASTPGVGTTVTVEIPVENGNGLPPSAPNINHEASV